MSVRPQYCVSCPWIRHKKKCELQTPSKKAEDFSYFNLNLIKADLEGINDDLKQVDWDYLFDICQPDADGSSFAELIRLTVLQICYIHAPTKDPPKVDKRPRVSRPRRILHRKRRKLKGRLNSLKSLNPDATLCNAVTL